MRCLWVHYCNSGSRAVLRGLPRSRRVNDGHEEERGEGGQGQAADDGPAQRGVLLAAFAQAQGHGQHADDHRQGGHDDGAQARQAGGKGGPPGIGARDPLIVGEGDHQDGIGGGHADAHDGAHEGGHADGGVGDPEHPEDAGQCAGKGHENDERVEPGLEVDDHDEIDEDDGEDQAEAQAGEGVVHALDLALRD